MIINIKPQPFPVSSRVIRLELAADTLEEEFILAGLVKTLTAKKGKINLQADNYNSTFHTKAQHNGQGS